MTKKYFENQYSILDDSANKNGLVQMGPMASYTWNTDPKRFLFVLSRYKFAARMLEGSSNVIEVGCGDGFASRIVKQHVNRLVLTDADPLMLDEAVKASSTDYPTETLCHNFIDGPIENFVQTFDGAYLLDVLEHIPEAQERDFFNNFVKCLTPNAKVVIGMPSLESQQYASPGSKAGHINCKTKEQLVLSLKPMFHTVSCFSMNDEVVHTGFNKMANYLFALCTF
jgi:2-polyprenyl-3-methyl-5-hydroxy-6-metoxy-1,4-benzoquinol methylase